MIQINIDWMMECEGRSVDLFAYLYLVIYIFAKNNVEELDSTYFIWLVAEIQPF